MAKPIPPVEKLKAVLFDIDGTLAKSDPLHLLAFREMLQEVGFQGGVPIDEEFFQKHISGRHNHDIGVDLFPSWDEERRAKFLDDKESLFRSLAAKQLKPVAGLYRMSNWVKEHGLHRAAVTNAPRENAELMISALGLNDFFELLVIGNECERPKPFPDPYLKALKLFGISSDEAFAFEDSPSGLKAAVGAGLSVVGLTTGNPGPILLDAGASFLIENYDDPALWDALHDS
ncbi:hypothetical protein O6H91_06G016100 [Diphasiastrum complanatum]|nr:hypothetical protein O6H91_06G016100 [Diphasiastrum complanatum]KAJ7551453.1 hypothetical protein O6H91_06G016100 [Diphasiastrum complanatum]KAJ7551454.1 hypothetical protein O6H91_06G016100 [Diphasiastrum complanatum]